MIGDLTVNEALELTETGLSRVRDMLGKNVERTEYAYAPGASYIGVARDLVIKEDGNE